MKLLLVAVSAVFATTLIPGNVSAQTNAVDGQRIQTLEKENAALRERVRRLEARKPAASHAAPAGSVPSPATYAMVTKAPVAPSPLSFSWTGFYVGGNAGYASVIVYAPGLPGNPSDTRPTGGFGGVQFGYNYQFNSNWVVGAEVDASLAAIKNAAIEPDPSTPTNLLAFNTAIDYMGTLRGRIGYAWDRGVVYATGGLAWDHDKVTTATASSNNVPGQLLISSADAMHVGWTIGAGIEHALAGDWTAKIEYLYVDFGDATYHPTPGPISAVPLRLTAQTVKVGVNYLFH
jgi:opacity protein-like surface antigen